VPTAPKIALIADFLDRVSRIEAVSFVHPEASADGLTPRRSGRGMHQASPSAYSALAGTCAGRRALDAALTELELVVSASTRTTARM